MRPRNGMRPQGWMREITPPLGLLLSSVGFYAQQPADADRISCIPSEDKGMHRLVVTDANTPVVRVEPPSFRARAWVPTARKGVLSCVICARCTLLQHKSGIIATTPQTTCMVSLCGVCACECGVCVRLKTECVTQAGGLSLFPKRH